MKDPKKLDKAIIRTELIALPTYPYSDPSPIPEFGRLYPYNRFDGYTNEQNLQNWEMVILENDYIKLWINPGVGGKIWGATEKSTGKEFIYFNHSAKFRDVAMRGPWTSGGMEINMGIIGHTPSCSAPVDYKTVEHPDGSVSCFLGATDWPSRTEWRVEISLKKDAAHFNTRCWWHNNSCMSQSYYQWNNVGIKAAGNLEYIYPGHNRLGHDGKALSWPKDEQDRSISFYDQNDHGEYKSYHIFGSYTDFWGCYWHDDQFGMGHSASYDDKPGKKIWIWGLSPYGMIWEDLLTDEDGQYTEVQSGRLFNQSIATSSKTPFKHRSFLPYTFDAWEETWFPVKTTGGLTYGNAQISFYITDEDGIQQINICANEPIDHQIKLLYQDAEVLNKPIQLAPMQTCNLEIPQAVKPEGLKVFLNEQLIFNGPEQYYPLKRPSKIDSAYNFNSTQALYLQAKEWERQRFFERAIQHYQLCLKKDPFFMEALNGLAGLYFKQMKFGEALNLLRRTLATDTYNGEANYLYGLVNERLNFIADAKDGLSIASHSLEYRIAALTELAKIALKSKELDKAKTYIQKVQACQPMNLQTLYLNLILLRLKGNSEEASAIILQILQIDPINYLACYEQYLSQRDGQPLNLTFSELPYETYIELSAFYANIQLYDDALNVLGAAPDYAMVQLWKAWLFSLSGAEDHAKTALEHAAALTADFVFPHREEDVNVLNWAVQHHDSWKFKYYLALAHIQNLRKEEALSLLQDCGGHPDFYPFYIVRANLSKELGKNSRLSDLKKAYAQAPDAWRTILNLSRFYAENEDWEQALEITKKGYLQYPENYYLGLHLAKCLMHTQNLDEAINLMSGMTVLPNEGASEGRNSWRETHLFSAFNALQAGDFDKALLHVNEARTWPENMGIGKPYDVDERLEDYMQFLALNNGNKPAQKALLHKIRAYRNLHKHSPYGSTDFLSILLLQESDDTKSAQKILEKWQKTDPDALALQWTQAYLKGDEEAIKELSRQKPVLKEALPYEIIVEDRSFLFIKKLYHSGLLKKQVHLATMS